MIPRNEASTSDPSGITLSTFLFSKQAHCIITRGHDTCLNITICLHVSTSCNHPRRFATWTGVAFFASGSTLFRLRPGGVWLSAQIFSKRPELRLSPRNHLSFSKTTSFRFRTHFGYRPREFPSCRQSLISSAIARLLRFEIEQNTHIHRIERRTETQAFARTLYSFHTQRTAHATKT